MDAQQTNLVEKRPKVKYVSFFVDWGDVPKPRARENSKPIPIKMIGFCTEKHSFRTQVLAEGIKPAITIPKK